MVSTSKLRKVYEEEKRAKEKRREERRKAKEAGGPFVVRAGKFIHRTVIISFHTVFLIAFVYVFVMSLVSFIPMIMGYIIGSFGYSLDNAAEIMLASLSGLFFTAWVFTISLFIVRKVFGIYINNVKKAMPESAGERLDELTK